jgi:hypothetical protein
LPERLPEACQRGEKPGPAKLGLRRPADRRRGAPSRSAAGGGRARDRRVQAARHASAKMTLDTYSHVIPDTLDRSADAIEKAINPANDLAIVSRS